MPKQSKINSLNDYRPVALTSIVVKCFERLVLKHRPDCKQWWDSIQGYDMQTDGMDNNLTLNIKKTKEEIIDFWRYKSDISSFIIHGMHCCHREGTTDLWKLAPLGWKTAWYQEPLLSWTLLNTTPSYCHHYNLPRSLRIRCNIVPVILYQLHKNANNTGTLCAILYTLQYILKILCVMSVVNE